MAGDWEKPGDPADATQRAASSPLVRLLDYLERHPDATLRSGEGALLAEEIKRLRRLLGRYAAHVHEYEGTTLTGGAWASVLTDAEAAEIREYFDREDERWLKVPLSAPSPNAPEKQDEVGGATP